MRGFLEKRILQKNSAFSWFIFIAMSQLTVRGNKKHYELWRQDDNGNRFLLGIHDNLESAEKRMAELSRYPHKQMYWISECHEVLR